MSVFGNNRRRPMGRPDVVFMTALAGWFVAVVAVVTPVWGQAPTGSEQAIDAPLLDQSHAQRAYRIVETWLSDPPEVPTRVQPIRVTGLIGVRLTLRTDGVLVGQGEAYREDLSVVLGKAGPSVDLIPLLSAATDRAKAGVLESLADARLRTVLEGRAIPEAGKLRVKDVSAGIIVELEFSYGLEPIAVPAKADVETVYTRYAPNYHGLAFIDPSTKAHAWLWPGEVNARNIAPSSQLVLGLKRLGYDRTAVAELARPGGVELARFKTLHLVRPRPGDDPVALVRGAIDLPRFAVGERELRLYSDLLMEHLNQRITSTGQVRGTYHPTSGRYDPPTAPDEQVALLCYAMLHYGRHLKQTRPNEFNIEALTHRAVLALDVLTDRIQLTGEAAETRVLSLVLLAMLDAPAAETDPAVRRALADRLLARVIDKDADPDGPDVVSLSDGDAALCAAATAALYERTRRPELGDATRMLTDRLWTDPDSPPNLSALPWLTLAQQHAGALLVDNDAVGAYREELARRRGVMARLIEELCRRQVIESPRLGPDDVLGGFVLSPGPAGAPPNPDWHNALPLMFLSVALRDAELTAGRDKLGWLLAAGLSTRFVGQLMMDDASCYYVPDRIAARGGVRMAPWDNRLAIAPSAMSLLALTEFQDTLAVFENRNSAKAIGPALDEAAELKPAPSGEPTE